MHLGLASPGYIGLADGILVFVGLGSRMDKKAQWPGSTQCERGRPLVWEVVRYPPWNKQCRRRHGPKPPPGPAGLWESLPVDISVRGLRVQDSLQWRLLA